MCNTRRSTSSRVSFFHLENLSFFFFLSFFLFRLSLPILLSTVRKGNTNTGTDETMLAGGREGREEGEGGRETVTHECAPIGLLERKLSA